jgi:predicted PurR-regulated permease PerM
MPGTVGSSSPDRPWTSAQGIRALIAAGATVGIAFFLRETADVFVPFTVAVLLTLAAYPLVDWMRRHRIPPWLSVSLIVLFFLVLLGVASLLIEQGVGSLMKLLPQFKNRATELWTSMAGRLGITGQPLEDLGNEPAAIRALAGAGGSTALSLATVLLQVMLVILYLILLLLGRRHLPALLRRALGQERARPLLRSIEQTEKEVLRYLLLRSCISLLTALAVGVILRLYGVKFAGLWALLTFFAQFVPFVGPILLSALPVLMALLQFPSMSTAVGIAGWLTLWHLFIGFVVEPKVFSVALSLNQSLVLLGLALFGWMWGIVGALLWVPIMMVLRLSARQIPGLHAVDVFLGRADGREASSG